MLFPFHRLPRNPFQGRYFMQSTSFIEHLAAFQVAIPFIGILRRNIGQHIFYCSKREWLFSSIIMEGNTGNSLSKEKRPLEGPTSDSETKRTAENNASTSIFINHAATTWQQNRREWVGDQSRKMKRMPKDPIISWSTTYEDLLCTDKPFPEPIPLPEMVDFLVDIWHDDSLYD